MTIDELRKEHEEMVTAFLDHMNDWLDVFNRYADRLIADSQKTAKLLEEIKHGSKDNAGNSDSEPDNGDSRISNNPKG